MSNDNPMVSIICNTYNHEKYIELALRGFLRQRTDYSFEILVYDDASTDKTADIIRKYEARYPQLVKPIYQTVNQFSLGLKPAKQNRLRAKGKYLAICEGDDYWIDKYKLQKQIDYMEKHPKCTFCFSNGLVKQGNTIRKRVIPWDRSCVYHQGKTNYDVSSLELLGYIPTASFIFRSELECPILSANSFQGDAFKKLVMTNYGYAHMFEEPMCIYHYGVENSLTTTWTKNDNEYIKACDRFISMYSELLDIVDYKHHPVLNMRICQWEIEKNYRSSNFKALKAIYHSKEWDYLKIGNYYSRLLYYIKCNYSRLYIFLRNKKNKVKK